MTNARPTVVYISQTRAHSLSCCMPRNYNLIFAPYAPYTGKTLAQIARNRDGVRFLYWLAGHHYDSGHNLLAIDYFDLVVTSIGTRERWLCHGQPATPKHDPRHGCGFAGDTLLETRGSLLNEEPSPALKLVNAPVNRALKWVRKIYRANPAFTELVNGYILERNLCVCCGHGTRVPREWKHAHVASIHGPSVVPLHKPCHVTLVSEIKFVAL